ncbi:MAG: M48 family metalloprotease [Bacteroidetes bacterium]|nr:M48 family metalloprotease [Bacteroidota bacterium]
MRDSILASGQLTHANDFVWKLYIIQDDNTQNAFCTPGGYIYVYTELIKYLDNASVTGRRNGPQKWPKCRPQALYPAAY